MDRRLDERGLAEDARVDPDAGQSGSQQSSGQQSGGQQSGRSSGRQSTGTSQRDRENEQMAAQGTGQNR